MRNVVKVGFNHAHAMKEEINWVIDSSRRASSNVNELSLNLSSWHQQQTRRNDNKKILPLKCFGQQTNSTPENNEIPHGSNIAKLRICILRSWQAVAPVWFHRTNGQQRDALWMWSNKQPSGTSKASDWKGPSVRYEKIERDRKLGSWILIENALSLSHNKIN